MRLANATIKVQVGAFGRRYVVYHTTAIHEYDQPSTVSLGPHPWGNGRVVLVPNNDDGLQLAIYGASRYGTSPGDTTLVTWASELLIGRVTRNQ